MRSLLDSLLFVVIVCRKGETRMKAMSALGLLAILLLLSACSLKEERIQDLQERFPQWDQVTVETVAAGRIETGMTPDMVRAAVGKPDIVEKIGPDEKWSFAVWKPGFELDRKVYVYFVFFTDGKVSKTVGDPNRLTYTHWYR